MNNCVLDLGRLQGCTTLIDVCQSSVTSCHIRCTHRLKLYSLKMARIYGRNKYDQCIINTNIVQLVGNKIFAIF